MQGMDIASLHERDYRLGKGRLGFDVEVAQRYELHAAWVLPRMLGCGEELNVNGREKAEPRPQALPSLLDSRDSGQLLHAL